MESTAAEFRTSALLERAGFRHAFFTRRGGVSEGPYASLNFSIGVGDSERNVEENLARAGAVLGVPGSRIHFLSQVHGAHTVVVAGTEDRTSTVRVEGDAILSRSPAVAVAVRIADCVPILVGDLRSGAALAIHAGWRGLVRGVVEAALATLRATVGGSCDPVAAIGPHISVEAFEVGDDVADALRLAAPRADAVVRRPGEKPHVSLLAIAQEKLREAGLRDEDVDVVPGCTLRDREWFFSFRRDGQKSGRHLAAIVPRAALP